MSQTQLSRKEEGRLVSSTCTLKPYYEANETQEGYSVRVFMPGVEKDKVSISLHNGTLSVKGTRTLDCPAGWRVLHQELLSGDYCLQLELNTRIDEAKIKAKIENGVLMLALPVSEAAKPRRISIA